MSDELKPCPFCGGTDLREFGGRIMCQCGAESPNWNRRAEDARIKELEGMLKECNMLLMRLSCVTVYPDSRDAEEMTQAIQAALKEGK